MHVYHKFEGSVYDWREGSCWGIELCYEKYVELCMLFCIYFDTRDCWLRLSSGWGCLDELYCIFEGSKHVDLSFSIWHLYYPDNISLSLRFTAKYLSNDDLTSEFLRSIDRKIISRINFSITGIEAMLKYVLMKSQLISINIRIIWLFIVHFIIWFDDFIYQSFLRISKYKSYWLRYNW